ncbi:uncharacterized protein DDB_G0287625 isoform X2 [Calliphora vicina]|uniref:uncharacterized protein DDB_G0287625 isoform X2 n=1 Tax=Calliphora vicina TaxID=7373 RepID=UPI00325B3C60
MMSSTLSKIHVTNSTGVSLNERFTAISTQPKVVTNIGTARRSRSRSVQRQVPVAAVAVDNVNSRANQRLLAQLQRKHKVQAALKLKRRSMRTVGGGSNGNGGANNRIRRGTVKAFRVGVNGKPIRTNSLTRVATMKADRESINNHSRPLRRNNSSSNLANRLGPRRPTVGGAAQRVAKRNIDRQRRGNGSNISGRGRSAGLNNRGRSRSRSRTRTLSDNGPNRSRTRNNNDNQLNGRNRSRNRNRNDLGNLQSPNNARRGRSRSRSRGRVAGNSNLPIKARLGVRPGAISNRAPNNRRRTASLTRRGVQTGRVQKRRNSTNTNAAAGNDNNGRGRIRSRSAARNVKNGNVRSRSRSRTRKGQVGQQRQQQQGTGQVRQQRNSRAPRGRIQQRRGNNSNNGQRGTNNNGKAQTQQRRGRSRSRTGRGGNNGSARNQA